MNLSAIVKPCQEKVFKQENIFCLFDQNQVTNFQPELLDANFWQAKNAVIGSATGRGTTYFVQHNQAQWVLRHYFRGGLIGKINRDSYLFYSLNKTRAVEEFRLLNWMRSQKLPVPAAIACRVVRKGLLYQADILTSRIENAQDLVGLLSKEVASENLWLTIGKTIARFHQLGVYHHDLNCHNILINEQQEVFLIDFDRCARLKIKKSWQQANMARLLRSFRKEKGKIAGFNWQEDSWKLLLEGYLSVIDVN